MFSQVILSYMTNIEAGTSKVNKCKLLTHLPLEILPKNTFEASQAVFWSLSCYKKPKLTIKPFTGHTLCGLLIKMQNIRELKQQSF